MRQIFSKLLGTGKSGADAGVQQPDAIHLVRDRNVEWAHHDDVAAAVRELRAAGFETITTFRIRELPALKLVGLAHPPEGYLAVVYEHQLAGAWCNLAALYDNGDSLTVSNAGRGRKLKPLPGHEKHLLRGASVDRLYRTLKRRLRSQPLVRVTPANFVELFEGAYAKEVAWRRGAAPPSAPEIASDPQLNRRAEPLFAALGAGDEVRVQEFLSRGDEIWRQAVPYPVEARDSDGRTPLMVAIVSGEPALATTFLERGADVNAQPPGAPGDAFGTPSLAFAGSSVGLTPLAIAIETGNAEIVAALVAAGAVLEGPGELTPLQLAAQQGDAEVAEVLIAAGAEVDRRHQDDYSPLLIAASEGFLDVVEMLVAAGADVELKCDGETAISLAAVAAAADVVEFLAPRVKPRVHKRAEKVLEEAGPPPDSRAKRLMMAAMNGKAPMAAKLLAAGVAADAVEYRDEGDKPVTPLMVASQGGHLGVMRLLIAAGANVNHSAGSDTPLQRALNPVLMDASKQPEVIRLLVDSGAHTFELSEEEQAAVAAAGARQSSSRSVAKDAHTGA